MFLLVAVVDDLFCCLFSWKELNGSESPGSEGLLGWSLLFSCFFLDWDCVEAILFRKIFFNGCCCCCFCFCFCCCLGGGAVEGVGYMFNLKVELFGLLVGGSSSCD